MGNPVSLCRHAWANQESCLSVVRKIDMASSFEKLEALQSMSLTVLTNYHIEAHISCHYRSLVAYSPTTTTATVTKP